MFTGLFLISAFTMGYATLGIPMAMVMFQSMGERMNKAFSVIIQKLKKWIGCSRTEASEFDLILVRFEPATLLFPDLMSALTFLPKETKHVPASS